jgi:serine/threonine protein kinase
MRRSPSWPSSPVPDRTLERGERLAGRYRIEKQIARGGMARLYRATDERLGRRVAVKLLASPYAEQAPAAERFLAEARTAASLSHPNLVHVYDSGVDEGAHYIVMELLEGYRSLRETLGSEGPLSPPRATELGLELLDGLAAVHRRDLVHRDVKSGNVMVGPGRIKLIDFGIAEATSGLPSQGTSIGSVAYMAPEQLRGEASTPRSDLYALGVVLYEATTGRLPFEGTTPEAILAAQRRGPVPPGRLAPMPPRLEAAILQALSPQPTRRFADAAAMATALRSVSEVDDDTTQIRPTLPPDGYLYLPPSSQRAAPAPAPPGLGRPPRGARTAGTLSPIVVGVALGLLLAGGLAFAVLNLAPVAPGESGSPTPAPAPTAAPGMVLVPDTIGMSEEEAEETARAAGLRWIIYWEEVPGASPGIYDQEPRAGMAVPPGSRLTMYSYRLPD